MNYYKASTWEASIVEIEVSRETATCVFIKARSGERRVNKKGCGARYFPTMKEAIDFQTKRLTDLIETRKENLRIAEAELASYKKLVEYQKVSI